ncbi:AT-rich interactive domain-containing protein 4B isoform X1 [Polypterus senegalus]|uniref:AT-rich interactive domain-containing protein 4B isoform X1 n=1 Tax=Polypterus senegalus TaxID=55291 RepID=UPI001964BE61|nr:AT-rich interactive domain-containing protein 4B isoform X1 [Polypterus senegalus]
MKMKTIDEPPYLPVGTDVSAKYRGAFCEAKIKTAKRLVKVKVTFKENASTGEVQDDHIKGPLKVGALVEVKTQDGTYHEAIINKLTDASWYTVVFDDGDEKTLRRSSLCLKGERHFAESETLDQLPLTNPEHFGTPVIGKKSNRGRRSNHVPEEESSSSSSEDEDGERRLNDELLGKVVCVECTATDKKKTTWYPALVISPDCNEEVAVKKDYILVRSFKDGKFNVVLRKDVSEINNEMIPKVDGAVKQVLDQALEFLKDGTVPSNWRTELKGDSSSSEEDEEEGGEEDVDADASSEEEEEEEVEPYPDERENFLQQLYKFMEDRGTPINKRPVLGYRNLNLFKLYRLVHNLGGFDNIDSGSVWKQVYQDLGIPVLNSAAGYNVKCAYRKYLYGFEEYCKSTGIKFQMALPEKIVGKPSKHLEEEETLGESLSLKPEPIPIKLQEEEAEEVEDEKEGEEETFIEPEQEITKELNLPKVEQINEGEEETDEKIKNTETPMLNVEKAEHQEEGRHAETSSDKLDDSLLENVKEEEEKENFRDESFKAGEGGEEEEEEEFECYPPGMKVQVRYGRGKNQKLYEASIKDSDLEGGEVLYLVHYCGWNVRYDEWIKADKIVRPADKNVPKIKHRKKIKSKIDKEKDKAANPDTEELLISKNSLIRRLSKSSVGSTPSDSFSKLDGSEGTENDVHAVRSLQLTDIINGLQGSESSGEESEHEEDYDEDDEEDNDDGQQLVKAQQQANSEQSQIEPLGCSLPFERWEIITPLNDCRSTSEKDQDHGHPSVPQQSLKTDTCEQLGNLGDEKRKWEDRRELPPKPQLKRKCRSSGASEWLRGASPERSGESAKASAIGLGSSSSSSGSSSSDDEEDKQPQVKEIENNKVKSTPSKKHNGLEEKRKCVRPAGFWDAMEKRPKLLSNSEDRLQNSRSKGQKDVWSSIQGQWPKKTLKELFSDSDTEAANSPPSEEFKKEPVLEEKIEKVPVEGKSIVEERGDKRVEFPSSGSNSVLNTPPTTPESPSLSVSRVEPDRTPAVSPPPTLDPPPPPPLSIGTGSSTLPHPPVQEESVGGRSETDSSTVEVESLGGELQELQSEGAASPVAFDTSLSSSSNSNSSININKSISSGSPPGGTENREKVLGSQKRPKEVQGGGPAKKLKRSQKNTAAHHKKSRKSTQTSDSEDQSAGENPTKVQLTKAAVSLKCLSQAKCTSRLNLPGKCSKHHDLEHKELNIQTQRAYKWSFQMAELEKMSSVDRIAFLQDKLQEIRQHYLSLKSEVASIDRRRKRLKKKERESVTASSSSSSPSSSITAAVMLTLADPPVSNSSQNNGVSLECR